MWTRATGVPDLLQTGTMARKSLWTRFQIRHLDLLSRSRKTITRMIRSKNQKLKHRKIFPLINRTLLQLNIKKE